jgi:endonuclease YncB( thermonuclease family)
MDMRGIITLVGMAAFFSTPAYADTDVKKEIIDRCKVQMGSYGSAMVKACVDQDLSAVAEIKQIPDEYKTTVARCMKQMRQYGFAMVKACADQDIEAEKALKEY